MLIADFVELNTDAAFDVGIGSTGTILRDAHDTFIAGSSPGLIC